MTTEIVEGGGLRWLKRPGSDDHLGYSGHEAFLGVVLAANTPEDGVFLDVGAHVGHWAVSMAKRASKVIAVEAWPSTMTTLVVNAKLNDVFGKIRFLQFAATDAQRAFGMADPNKMLDGGSRRLVAKSEPADGLVEGVPLDDMLGNEDRIDCIKMDIEGHEVHALGGLTNTIARLKPAIVLEMHDPLYPDRGIRAGCEKFFDDAGYQVYLLLKHATPEGVPVCEYWLATPKESG